MRRVATTRRRVVATLSGLTAGLSGCLDGAAPGDDAGAGSSSDDAGGSTGGDSDDGTDRNDGSGEDDADGGTDVDGAWPSTKYGPANTGAVPGAAVPAELNERWRQELPGSLVGSPAVLEDHLVVSTGHSEGVVVALDRETGEEAWRAWTSSDLYTEPIVADGTAFVGDITGRLNAIDLADPPEDEAPELVKVEFPFSGAPAVADGIAYFGDDDGVAYGFDLAAEEVRWTTETGEYVRTGATVVDGTVYLGNGAGDLVALRTDDGSERWRDTDAGAYGATPAVADGAVLAADFDGVVRALDAADGATLWTAPVEDTVREAVAVADGTAVVADDSGTVTALSLSDGAELWRRDVREDALVYGVAATEETVVAHLGDERVLALDLATGDRRAEFRAGGGLWGRPTIADGEVYVGTSDRLYALGE